MDIVTTMIPIADAAKKIYKTEPLTYMLITVNDNYVTVEAQQVDDEHLSCWGIEKINASDKQKCIDLIQRIKFPDENVYHLKDGIEIYIRNSPRLQAVKDAIYDLKNGNFYDELHNEDNGYTVITHDIRGLKEWQQKHSKVAHVYRSDFGDALYNVYIS